MPEVRPVDANALYNDLKESAKAAREWKEEAQDEEIKIRAEQAHGTFCECALRVKNAPTIEAEPVRHGRWIEKPPYEDETVKGLEFQIVCSECDEQNSSITFDENSVPIAKTFYRTKFCPNCGAKMDGGAEDA